MSALTLPLDSRESNNYIHALERQFKGKFRVARDLSVYFTGRPDSSEDVYGNEPAAFYQQYKLLYNTLAPEPSISAPLDTQLELAQYQLWADDTGQFTVSGTGVLSLNGYWLIPSGTEVTVTQNGSGSVPSAETFIAATTPFIAWILLDGETVTYFLPHTGKAWYGVLTAPAEDSSNTDNIRIVLLMADGTYHSQKFGQQVNENFVFFTHLYNDSSNGNGEVYFTGKELEYVPEGLPTNTYVAPTFIYVPD